MSRLPSVDMALFMSKASDEEFNAFRLAIMARDMNKARAILRRVLVAASLPVSDTTEENEHG